MRGAGEGRARPSPRQNRRGLIEAERADALTGRRRSPRRFRLGLIEAATIDLSAFGGGTIAIRQVYDSAGVAAADLDAADFAGLRGGPPVVAGPAAFDTRWEAGGGDDTHRGGEGNDSVEGGAGEDVLDGGDGDDYLLGRTDDDTLLGGAGRDVLKGGRGNDSIDDGAGDDRLLGGAGRDTLAGGAGDDVFRFNSWEGGGRDVIRDYGAGADVIELNLPKGSTGSGLSFRSEAGGTLITGGNFEILVQGPDGAGLTLSEIEIV